MEDKNGHEVAWEQFALASKALPKPKTAKAKRELVSANGDLLIPDLAVAPKLTLWRAPTDNDDIGKVAYKWSQWGLRELKLGVAKVSKSGGKTKVNKLWLTSTGIVIKHSQEVEAVENGFKVTETINLPKELNDVARVGINFELNKELHNFQYFGVGPHETVSDRAIGRIGTYSSTVDKQLTDYIKPQECGGHVGVRWFELTDSPANALAKNARGIRITLDKPQMVTVLPVTSEALATATHNVYVKRSGTTVVTIDAAHRGVGTASCGPDTLDNYKIKPGTYRFTWYCTSI